MQSTRRDYSTLLWIALMIIVIAAIIFILANVVLQSSSFSTAIPATEIPTTPIT